MIAMKMSESGRVVIPIEIRRALGLGDGDSVVRELRDGEARVTSSQAQLRQAQPLISAVNLAAAAQAVALTADRPWLALAPHLGLDIRSIRPDAH